MHDENIFGKGQNIFGPELCLNMSFYNAKDISGLNSYGIYGNGMDSTLFLRKLAVFNERHSKRGALPVLRRIGTCVEADALMIRNVIAIGQQCYFLKFLAEEIMSLLETILSGETGCFQPAKPLR